MIVGEKPCKLRQIMQHATLQIFFFCNFDKFLLIIINSFIRSTLGSQLFANYSVAVNIGLSNVNVPVYKTILKTCWDVMENPSNK